MSAVITQYWRGGGKRRSSIPEPGHKVLRRPEMIKTLPAIAGDGFQEHRPDADRAQKRQSKYERGRSPPLRSFSANCGWPGRFSNQCTGSGLPGHLARRLEGAMNAPSLRRQFLRNIGESGSGKRGIAALLVKSCRRQPGRRNDQQAIPREPCHHKRETRPHSTATQE